MKKKKIKLPPGKILKKAWMAGSRAARRADKRARLPGAPTLEEIWAQPAHQRGMEAAAKVILEWAAGR